jgi:hypothetical protein
MEDWQLRNEARRCRYNAMTAEGSTERTMFVGLSRFYATLADNSRAVPPRSCQPLDAFGPDAEFIERPQRLSPKN